VNNCYHGTFDLVHRPSGSMILLLLESSLRSYLDALNVALFPELEVDSGSVLIFGCFT
jgi:hypothetical protein